MASKQLQQLITDRASLERSVHEMFKDISVALGSMLIPLGISSRDAEFLLRAGFVKAARAELEASGQKATLNRVGARLNLNRKIVREVQSYLDAPSIRGQELTVGSSGDGPANVIARVLHYWFEDPEFQNELGGPMPLKKKDMKADFAALAAKHGKDLTPNAILLELIENGTVVETDEGYVPIRRQFIPRKCNSDMLEISAHSVSELIETIAYNMAKDSPDDPGRLHMRAFSMVPESQVADLQKEITELARNFLTIINEKIESAGAGQADGERLVKIGIATNLIRGEVGTPTK